MLLHLLSRNYWQPTYQIITEQYYGMKKMNGLAKIKFLFRRSITFNKQALFDFKKIYVYIWCPYAKMVKGWVIIALQIRRWSWIALCVEGITFLNAKGDMPICSPELTFKCLYASYQNRNDCIFNTNLYIYIYELSCILVLVQTKIL